MIWSQMIFVCISTCESDLKGEVVKRYKLFDNKVDPPLLKIDLRDSKSKLLFTFWLIVFWHFSLRKEHRATLIILTFISKDPHRVHYFFAFGQVAADLDVCSAGVSYTILFSCLGLKVCICQYS